MPSHLKFSFSKKVFTISECIMHESWVNLVIIMWNIIIPYSKVNITQVPFGEDLHGALALSDPFHLYLKVNEIWLKQVPQAGLCLSTNVV